MWELVGTEDTGFMQRFDCETPPIGAEYQVLEDEWLDDPGGSGTPRRVIKRILIH